MGATVKKPRAKPATPDLDPRLLAAQAGWDTTLRYAFLLLAAKPLPTTWGLLLPPALYWGLR